VQVCQEGIEQARQQHANVVILDTAGRLAIDQELMEQLKQIDRQVKPDQIYLVVDGMTGQDAVNSASAFHAALELDGAILTKLDGDARGGALLSVKAVTQVPIKFIGTGEHLDALEPFRPEGMASRILEMGDMLEVAREAHRLIDDQERERLEERLQSGKFSLEDFRDMIQKMRKPGLMQKMLGLMPGMGAIKDALAQAGDQDGEMARISGIIDSMTPGERQQPEIIDIQRRHRIARGAGVQAVQVSDLIKQFQVMGPLLQLMSTGKMTDRLKALQQIQGGMAGMPGMSLENMKVKQSTGKRLSPKEREKLQKERERKLRQMKRKGK
jgi:signal recognition particle subunit SRP54